VICDGYVVEGIENMKLYSIDASKVEKKDDKMDFIPVLAR